MNLNLNKDILLRIYRAFKNNKNKTFIAKDFGNSETIKKYLNTLESLDIIVKANKSYLFMGKKVIAKDIRAYKFNDKEKLKGGNKKNVK